MSAPCYARRKAGAKLLQHRLANNGALPTWMKKLFSNLSSWTAFSSNDYRLRRCRRFLRQGPVCLQETKWKGHEPEALYKIFQELRLPSLLLLPSMDARAPAGLPSCFRRAGLSLRKLSWSLVEVLLCWSKIKQVNGCFAMSRVLVQSLVEVIHACVEGIPFCPNG